MKAIDNAMIFEYTYAAISQGHGTGVQGVAIGLPAALLRVKGGAQRNTILEMRRLIRFETAALRLKVRRAFARGFLPRLLRNRSGPLRIVDEPSSFAFTHCFSHDEAQGVGTVSEHLNPGSSFLIVPGGEPVECDCFGGLFHHGVHPLLGSPQIFERDAEGDGDEVRWV